VIVAETEDDSVYYKTLDLRAVEADIKKIRGIGEKRAEEIMLIFEKHLGIQ
jgi:ERCC4-type nuclease